MCGSTSVAAAAMTRFTSNATHAVYYTSKILAWHALCVKHTDAFTLPRWRRTVSAEEVGRCLDARPCPKPEGTHRPNRMGSGAPLPIWILRRCLSPLCRRLERVTPHHLVFLNGRFISKGASPGCQGYWGADGERAAVGMRVHVAERHIDANADHRQGFI